MKLVRALILLLQPLLLLAHLPIILLVLPVGLFIGVVHTWNSFRHIRYRTAWESCKKLELSVGRAKPGTGHPEPHLPSTKSVGWTPSRNAARATFPAPFCRTISPTRAF